ncbi:MAG TPA: hypothetical protein VK457_09015, partial [Chloroflexota bacterium]|nr:hypothetical protein [Chloroflexota bacterium]
HSLQVSGWLQTHTAPVPAIGLVGLFPTWESTILQLALLAAVGLALVLTSGHKDEPLPSKRDLVPSPGGGRGLG